jgi:hypothetical protein
MLTKEERETIIRIAGDQRTWQVWSDDKKFITKFTKAGYKGKRTRPGDGMSFSVPMKGISVRKLKSVTEPKRRNSGIPFVKKA